MSIALVSAVSPFQRKKCQFKNYLNGEINIMCWYKIYVQNKEDEAGVSTKKDRPIRTILRCISEV